MAAHRVPTRVSSWARGASSRFNGGGDWTVVKPNHWMFKGTGMKKGDAIPGIVGWEHHGAPAKLPGLEIVAEGHRLGRW